MLKFLFYIWNLFDIHHKRLLFEQFGFGILSAFLITIVNNQYLLLAYLITKTSNIQNIVISLCLFTWMISMLYYYNKYILISKQHDLYKILSQKHYAYILNRIANNAPLFWLDNFSKTDLALSIQETDKGLREIISFITNFIRLAFIVIFSVIILLFNYPFSSVFIFILGLLFNIILFNSSYIINYNNYKDKYKYISTKMNTIIHNNISLLTDSILNNTYTNILHNITSSNGLNKKEQTKLFIYEDKFYMKISISLITGFLLFILLYGLYITDAMQFMNFFISSLLTYKTLNTNINEIIDMLNNIRQAYIDFDNLYDIWAHTEYKRLTYPTHELNTPKITFDDIELYNNKLFDLIQDKQLTIADDFLKLNNLEYDVIKQSSKTYKLEIKSYYLVHKDELVKLKILDTYISQNFKLLKAYQELLDAKILLTPRNIFDNISYEKDLEKYELKIKNFNHPYLYSEEDISLSSTDLVLIDGESGSGKTTFLNIIRGICHIDSYIYINDAELCFENIAPNIYYYRQNDINMIDGFMYQIMTDDYSLKKTDLTDEQINNMHIALFVAKFKIRNISLKVSINKLSGGELKRLKLAKALYRIIENNSDIIILDEFDAGLDYDTAFFILSNMILLFKNKLFILTLHTYELKSLITKKINIKNGIVYS